MFRKLFLLFFLTPLNGIAQEVSVEKSIVGVHTGLVGIWVNHEFKLSSQFAFRSEIGLELGSVIKGSTGNRETIYVGAPTLSVEPRWYYNLDKRNGKGYNIAKNSGNLFSVKFNYNPDSFLITNDKNLNVVNQLAFIPKWGIRRVYGKHFTLETGFGLGPVVYFEKVANPHDVYIDAHLRVGYTF